MHKIIKLIFFVFITINLYGHQSVITVSSDGNQAFTTDEYNNAYLWNIKNKTFKKVNKEPVNIYSAYFVPDSNNFMYQLEKSNEVIIQNVKGEKITSFNPVFKTYGQAVSPDMKTWVGSDIHFNAYRIDIETKKKKQIFVSWCNAKQDYTEYYSANHYMGPLPNGCAQSGINTMDFHFKNNDILVATVSGRLFIFNFKTHNWYSAISGLGSNAISPDGGYASTADSNGHGVIYNFENGKYKTLSWIRGVINDLVKSWFDQNTADALTSINYIADNLILITSHGIPKPFLYVSLYNPNKMQNMKIEGKDYPINKAIKYIPLVKNPNAQYPADNGIYPQTQSFMPVVATSPEAHIMVIAQANGGGIMVYQFNPDNQTLKLIWAPEL